MHVQNQGKHLAENLLLISSTEQRFLWSVHAAVMRENSLSTGALVMGMLNREDATAVRFGVIVPLSKMEQYTSYSSSISSFPLICRASTASLSWENVNLLFSAKDATFFW